MRTETTKYMHITRILAAIVLAFIITPSFAGDKVISVKKPAKRSSAIAKAQSQTSLLYESFENATVGYNQPSGELPEGWTRTGNESGDVQERWFTYYGSVVEPADGNLLMEILYDSNYKDEQIITPSVAIADEGYELSFYWWVQPLYLFRVGNEFVDYEKHEWIKHEVAANLEVLVQEEGSDEWTKVFDLAEKFVDMPFEEIKSLSFDKMQRATVSLNAYAKKSIKVAFRYVGTDGDSMFLDAVSIDLAPLNAHYSAPLCRQFYGLSLDGNMNWLTNQREYYPHNTDLTWYNNSRNEETAVYQWLYDDPTTGAPATSDDQYELTLNFDPETMTAEEGQHIFNTPTLTATAEGCSDASYQGHAKKMQIGGKPSVEVVEDGEKKELTFGLLPFDIKSEGLDIYVKEPFDFGREDIPVFGYSEDSDQWWENYTFPGGAAEGDFAYCTGFINWIQIGTTPMWLRGANVAAVGDISDDAQFRLEVRKLEYDEESGDYLIKEEPEAVAHLSGAEVLKFDRGLNTKFLSLNFRFDKTLVIEPEKYVGGFLVEVTGYHDGGVRYFAPMQSMVPNEDELCLGFYRHHRRFAGYEDDNYSYCAFFQTDDGRDLYTTFAISLDAEYPLPGETDGIENIEEKQENAASPAGSYNIAGQKVGNNYKGIVITNGKKEVKRL